MSSKLRPTPPGVVYGRASVKFARLRTVEFPSMRCIRRQKKRARGGRSFFSRILSHPRNPTVIPNFLLPSSVWRHEIYFLPPSCRARAQVLEFCLLGRRMSPPSVALEHGQKRRRCSTSPGSACSSSAIHISGTRYETWHEICQPGLHCTDYSAQYC